MIVWIFAAIGFVIGAIVGGLGEGSSASFGALMGAVTGFVIGHGVRSFIHSVSSRQKALSPEALTERVAHIEAQIQALGQELAQMRGQLAGASADQADSAKPLAAAAQAPHSGEASAATRASKRPRAQFGVRPERALAAAAVSSMSSASSTLPAQSMPVQPVQPAQPTQPVQPPQPAFSAQSIADARNVAFDAGKSVAVDSPASVAAAGKPPSPAVHRPDPIERAIQAARDWLFGGNTVVRVGIIVLFFGLAFLLKFAADNSMLPVEFRLAGVALGAVALLVTGWRIGHRRYAYGLVLQGGGVGALYLTVFAATKLYHLLPSGAAFALMVVVCALSAFLAVRQNASALAFMGSAGGFLAPVLLATGGGSHVALFSYYALLNAGIFAIAWFRAWRSLNLLGFAFTVAIGAAWGVRAYRPEMLASTEPFLVLFFLMYAGIALLYGVRREIALKHYVDGTLVFGTPIVAIGLQAALLRHVEFGLAWSAVALAGFYLGVALWLARRRARLALLFEAMLALGVIFATLAVPLAFSGPTTGAAWAIEGAAIVWVGVRERRLAPVVFGLLMQVAAGGAFWIYRLVAFAAEYSAAPLGRPAALPVLNGDCIAALLIALGGLFTGWWLHGRNEARAWRAGLPAFGLAAAGWGLLWWLGCGVSEIVAYAMPRADGLLDWLDQLDRLDARFVLNALVLFVAASAWLAHGARRRLAWALAEWPALALAPVLAALALVACARGAAPLSGLGALAWPLACASAYLLLWRQEHGRGPAREHSVPARWLAPLHTLMFWNLSGLCTLEACWRVFAWVPEGTWRWSAWAYGLGALLVLLAGVGSRLRWPVTRFARAYQLWGALPLAALLWGWSLASVTSDGDASPLFWLPLLNPLDVAQLLVFVAFFAWLRRLKALGLAWPAHAGVDYAALATVFVWFNALLLRTLHHRFHAAYEVDAVLASFGRQQVFLAGWSAFAFAGMWLSRRNGLARFFAIACSPVVLVMWCWTFYANLTQSGGRWAAVPLLNPFDLVQVAIYALAALWLARVRRLGAPLAEYRVPLYALSIATGFVWLNTMLLRALSHWSGLAYTFDAMSHSMLVQASVSVFWTLCALPTMIWATRRAIRSLWFVGAALLALTVVKLFLFDLSHVTGVERIVSFIGIGVLLLLIGYFSPLPPRARNAASPAPQERSKP